MSTLQFIFYCVEDLRNVVLEVRLKQITIIKLYLALPSWAHGIGSALKASNH